MNLFTKLVISLITAGIAAAAISQFSLGSTLHIWLVVSAATLATTFLSLIKMSRPAASSSSSQGKSKETSKTAAPKKSAPRKSSGVREEGEVKWFNVSKGFGFIVRENGEEIFVHFRSILGDDRERRSLRDGQRVSFEVSDSDKGPQAEEVEPL
jgi:CspA family cold shock protein